MVSGHLVELTLGDVELLFVLRSHDLQVELEEPLDQRYLLDLQAAEALEEFVEGCEKPLVELGPVGGEVIVD